MNINEQLQQAFDAFDLYNSADPNKEIFEGDTYAKEVLYALRMTEKLNDFAFDAPDYLQLAARSQHIGRWEIARNEYPMNRKGYLLWRSQLKLRHAAIAEKILRECKYDDDTIEKVKALLIKKQLHENPDTQLLEDVICLVFILYYLDEFAAKHEDDKAVHIIQKTLKKMSPQGIAAAVKIPVSSKVSELIARAAKV